MWNGEFTEEFKPSRWVRQGDPLSPFLFVLTMERSGHVIHMVVVDGKWKSVTLGSGGPSLSHLLFANDLVLFGEATLENAKVMHEIIDEFCKYSGHKVSSSKSKFFFSKNTDDVVKDSIVNVLGFQLTEDLVTYLGVSLFHTRTKKCTFQFIVDEIQNKLNGYNVELLSLAGRVMLAKSVLLTIPSYFMQSAMIPVGI